MISSVFISGKFDASSLRKVKSGVITSFKIVSSNYIVQTNPIKLNLEFKLANNFPNKNDLGYLKVNFSLILDANPIWIVNKYHYHLY